MALYGLSDAQLEKLMYPNGRGVYHYGNTPVMVNGTGGTVNGVVPGGVSMVGSTPVQTGVAVDSPGNAAMGVAAGTTAPGATAMPAGAAAGAAPSMAGYASLAGGAIQQIAGVASDYVGAKAKADALMAQKGVPNIPQDESAGALAHVSIPQLQFSPGQKYI